MNPNDTDGHQVGGGLGNQQPSTFTPNPGSAFNAPQAPIVGNSEMPQAPIISSTPDPDDGKQSSSITRAFGGRTRADRIAAQAPAQPSALRQNAPEFFQQGMQQQDIIMNAAAEQKAKSKKGLLIGGIVGAIAVVAAIIAVVVMVIPHSSPSTTDAKLEEYEDFLEASIATINKYDALLQAADDESIGLQTGITEEVYKKSKESLNKDLEEIKALSSTLEDNLGLKFGDSETQEKISALEKELVDSLSSRLSVYEKYKEVSLALNEVYRANGSDESIASFVKTAGDSDYTKAVANKMQGYYTKKRTYLQTWKSNDCNNKQSLPVCASLTDEMLTLDREYNQDSTLSKLFASYNGKLGKDPVKIIRDIQTIIETEQKQ